MIVGAIVLLAGAFGADDKVSSVVMLLVLSAPIDLASRRENSYKVSTMYHNDTTYDYVICHPQYGFSFDRTRGVESYPL